MKKLVLSLVAVLFVTQVWASGNQQTSIQEVASGVVFTTVGTQTVVQSGTWVIGTVTAIEGNVTVQATNLDIRDLNSSQDSVSAVQSGNWTIITVGTVTAITGNVTVTATDLGIRNLGYAADSVKIYGSEGVPVKTDADGQIYAVTSAASVDAIEKAYAFSDIATGSWIEIGSYTVTTAKSLKIDGVKFTGGYDLEFKVSDGTTGDEIYGQTAPANPNDTVSVSHPGAKVAATVITVFAKTTEATNSGTIRVMGFEYTP